jgi:hypothetical protein
MDTPEILARSDFTYRPADGSGPWRVRLTMALVEGHPQVVAVEMFAVDPRHVAAELPNAPERVLWPADLPAFTAPISATDVRLPLGRLREKWERETYRTAMHVRDVESWKMTVTARSYAAHLADLLGDGSPGRGGRPPVYDRKHFEIVAEMYKVADSTGRSPTLYVKTQWKRQTGREISYSTAQKWISKCRQLDPPLLPPTTRGKVTGGEPTREDRR